MIYVISILGFFGVLGLFNIGNHLRYLRTIVSSELYGIREQIIDANNFDETVNKPYMNLATVAMQDRVLDLQRKQAVREHNERNAMELIHAKAENDRADYIKSLTMGILQVNHYNISVEEAKAMAEGIMMQFDSVFAPSPAESLDDEPSAPNMGTEQPPTDSIQ